VRVSSLEKRCDAQNDETTGIHYLPVLSKFKGSWPTVLGSPCCLLSLLAP